MLLAYIILIGLTKGATSAKQDIDSMAVWPYVPRELMTAPERELFVRLRQALPEYLIFSQVQLCRMIEVDPNALGYMNPSH